jgi:hypothetical protein
MNDQIGIYDHTTGEYTTREMTDKEQAERNAEIENSLIAKEKQKAEIKEKIKAKSALLEKLGITEDEAKLLLG